MNVVMLSPGFPDDMPHFTRGLAAIGARVFGVGDQPRSGLKPEVAAALTDYLQVRSLWQEEDVAREVSTWMRGRTVDRVECLWEPGMVVAARLREVMGIPGLTVEQTIPFRDKERMKQVLDAAGVRTPRHARARTAHEVFAGVEQVGYPAIVKPIAGAGSADTYRIDDEDDLQRALIMIGHVPEVSVEEFIEGEEYTYDTVCSQGRILFENVAWYRPGPLTARQNPWISPQAICMRDLAHPDVASGVAMGHKVIEALGFDSGFTHMEWFRKPDGEAVFGEIGGRSPGGRLTHVMNYSCEADLFRGWAEAVCTGAIRQNLEKRYYANVVFKRAEGTGRIRRYEGLDHLMAEFGENVAHIDLVPIGSPRRDWRKVVTGDGWIVVRHPDLATVCEIGDRFGTDLRIFAA
ncbi:MAG: ATP-grasp domain-containing protein [Planctomycetes bacterium]|nr:ATP-grasp domain-containing protein [Planctomycetota bacterium]